MVSLHFSHECCKHPWLSVQPEVCLQRVRKAVHGHTRSIHVVGFKISWVRAGCEKRLCDVRLSGHCMLFLWLSCAKEFGYLAFWSRHFHWRWMYGYMAHCILECQSSNTEFLQAYITNWYAFWEPACQPWHATSARLIVSTNWQRKEEAKSSKRKASAAKRIIGRAFK